MDAGRAEGSVCFASVPAGCCSLSGRLGLARLGLVLSTPHETTTKACSDLLGSHMPGNLRVQVSSARFMHGLCIIGAIPFKKTQRAPTSGGKRASAGVHFCGHLFGLAFLQPYFHIIERAHCFIFTRHAAPRPRSVTLSVHQVPPLIWRTRAAVCAFSSVWPAVTTALSSKSALLAS